MVKRTLLLLNFHVIFTYMEDHPIVSVSLASFFNDTGRWNVLRTSSLTDMLTKRETEIFINVKKGLTNEEIAKNLGINPRTVSNIISCILDKTGIKNRRTLEKI